jgi:hypothetical protein
MSQLLTENPWLALCALVAIVIVACVAIVVSTDYLRTSRQAEIDATLKQDMLDRGMSAADIKTVLEAMSGGEAARMALNENQGVRVGLGNFRVEVGAVNETTPTAKSPAGHA